MKGFPGSSAGKESACNAGDPGLIPGSWRSPGERIGYPLQYSWASLVAQLVKNLPAMQETWVQSLGWEDPLEKGKATHSILARRIPWTVDGVAKTRIWLSDFHFPRSKHGCKHGCKHVRTYPELSMFSWRTLRFEFWVRRNLVSKGSIKESSWKKVERGSAD